MSFWVHRYRYGCAMCSSKRFDRFVRLKDIGYADVPGLGLGLTGVKTLVEAMGGEITLVSRQGFGTSFRVRIPPLQSR